MQDITFVTGNVGKLREYMSLLPKDSGITVNMHKLDLPEIQSLDLETIVKDKIERAYAILQTPVIVEDVSAGLDHLHGLPGPFIKFFEEKLGPTALLQLAGKPGAKVTITCTSGFYDGHKMIFGTGTFKGAVCEPRGENGFGFDQVIIPNGSTLTFAEMSAEQKNDISHRSIAIKSLLHKITKI